MGNIVRLPGDRHRETQLLLPWYATGQLDEADRARVEAHLAGCARCRADLRLERRMETEIASLPLDVEQGWAEMRRRVEAEAAPTGAMFGRLRTWGRGAGRLWRTGGPWAGWAMAAVVLVFAVSGWLVRPEAPAARYHTLSSPGPNAPGNAIVIFRPEATEAGIRRSLDRSSARIVDGPTSAGAYVLRVPADDRPKALDDLRASGEVELAQPIDSGPSP
jgi:anti-sigma factor RsiW